MSDLRGRFNEPAGEAMRRFSSSTAVDLRMLAEEIRASDAHAAMLGEVGILGSEEAKRIRDGLAAIAEEFAAGAWRPDHTYDDIHMAVEARLIEHIGDDGKKLHTARSRNDLVATDVRLWLKGRLGEADDAVGALVGVLLDRVESDGQTLIPGYTHLQRGQPILLGHQLLAHAWALTRDRQRLAAALDRLDLCPLGACAMAGTPLPIDRAVTAKLLGFRDVADNAMDAVAARDHEEETAAACAICMTHLSRMAEELVLWSSTEFGLLRISEGFATGSSIMPQKRNPDAAELIRGKAAVVAGNLQALLGMTRAVPMAYNRDFQESRAPLFDAVEATVSSLRIMAGMWESLQIDRERFESELEGDLSLATELADHLAGRGVPFRDAHGIVARIVRWCEERKTDLSALTPEVARGFHPELGQDLSDLLDPRAAVERRVSLGGTAWSEVERQLALLRKELRRDFDKR